MFDLGICSVSFRSLSAEEVIRAVAAAGLSVIEWGSDVHAPCTDKKRLKEIAEAQKAAGLRCSSYGTYFKVGENSPEELRDYIAAAKILGTNMLRIWCGKKDYEELGGQERDFIISECLACAKIAEEEGAVLSAECHPRSFTNSADGALALMNGVSSPAFRMYWQDNSRATFDVNYDYAERISDYVTNIHVSYYEDGKQSNLDMGIARWKKYLSCFKPEGALLLEFVPGGTPEVLPREAKGLKAIAL